MLHEQEVDETKRLEEQAKRPAFVLPRNIVDDWTGQRFLEPCHGQYPCPAERKALLQLDAELQTDPMDPSLADVDKIMDRYKEKDARAELE